MSLRLLCASAQWLTTQRWLAGWLVGLQVEVLGYSQATREDLTGPRCRKHEARLLQVRSKQVL